jgi:hypothetical protein
MTLLIAFPLQVIVSYFILHHFSSLTYHLITYLLPSSHILSHRVHHTHYLHPLYLSITRSSPPLILSHISSELLSHILIALFILVFVSCPCLCQNH